MKSEELFTLRQRAAVQQYDALSSAEGDIICHRKSGLIIEE